MMFKIFVAVLAVLPASVVGVCENDKTKFFPWGDKDYSCSRLRMKNNAGPRYNLCQTAEVRTACPHTCGLCCEDSTTYEFDLKNPPYKKKMCPWILQSTKEATDAKRVLDYCNGYSSNGGTVRSACQKSCNFCFNDVLAVPPTPAPVVVPTPAPVTPAPVTPAPVTPAPVDTDGTPSAMPSRPPSPQPSPFPSAKPSTHPSDSPSNVPSKTPSDSPSGNPSKAPSDSPSRNPSESPSGNPSKAPSDAPSLTPSDSPSGNPSKAPSDSPSLMPSVDPSDAPSFQPSDSPSLMPSKDPSIEPTANPTKSIKPSALPSAKPSGLSPTPAPTPAPTPVPTPAPVNPAPACMDSSTNFTLDNGKSQNCAWLTEHKTAATNTKRQQKYCGRSTVGCDKSCGYCPAPCTDDATFTFPLVSNPAVSKPCSYITQSADSQKTIKRRAKYCADTYSTPSAEYKGTVNFRCPNACKKCAAA